MTTEQQARAFLRRFLGVTSDDVVELAAMLDVAREAGADDAGWNAFEPTNPGTPDAMLPLIAASARA